MGAILLYCPCTGGEAGSGGYSALDRHFEAAENGCLGPVSKIGRNEK